MLENWLQRTWGERWPLWRGNGSEAGVCPVSRAPHSLLSRDHQSHWRKLLTKRFRAHSLEQSWQIWGLRNEIPSRQLHVGSFLPSLGPFVFNGLLLVSLNGNSFSLISIMIYFSKQLNLISLNHSSSLIKENESLNQKCKSLWVWKAGSSFIWFQGKTIGLEGNRTGAVPGIGLCPHETHYKNGPFPPAVLGKLGHPFPKEAASLRGFASPACRTRCKCRYPVACTPAAKYLNVFGDHINFSVFCEESHEEFYCLENFCNLKIRVLMACTYSLIYFVWFIFSVLLVHNFKTFTSISF